MTERAMKIRELMTRDVTTVARHAPLDEAMARMADRGIRHLPVVEDGHVVGVLSERDLLEATGWLPPRLRELLDAPSGDVGDFMHAPVATAAPGDSVATAAGLLAEWSIGCLPVLEDGNLIGFLTESDVLAAYTRACRAGVVGAEDDPPIEEVMRTELPSADPLTLAEEALELCRARHARHLPVLDGHEFVGLVSDRDLRLALGRGQLEGTPLGELLTGEPLTASPATRLSSAAETLVQERIGALPVLDDGRMLGLLGTIDVLNHCTRALAPTSRASGS